MVLLNVGKYSKNISKYLGWMYIRNILSQLEPVWKTKLKKYLAVLTRYEIIAANGRVLKANLFIVWLYLFKKIYNVNTGKTLGKLPWKSKIPLQGNGMPAISKIIKKAYHLWISTNPNFFLNFVNNLDLKNHASASHGFQNNFLTKEAELTWIGMERDT